MDNHGTHRLFVKLAHEVLADHPPVGEDLARLKDACRARRIGWTTSSQLVAALKSAAWQRGPRRPIVTARRVR